MNKFFSIKILFFIFVFQIFYMKAMEFGHEPQEFFHYFGPEDIYEKEVAEKIYKKKIKKQSGPDLLGEDSSGEDIIEEEEKTTKKE